MKCEPSGRAGDPSHQCTNHYWPLVTNAVGHPHISDHSGDQTKSRQCLRGGTWEDAIFSSHRAFDVQLFTHPAIFFPSYNFLLFFLCPSCPSKNIFSLSKYFPPFPSLFFFSTNQYYFLNILLLFLRRCLLIQTKKCFSSANNFFLLLRTKYYPSPFPFLFFFSFKQKIFALLFLLRSPFSSIIFLHIFLLPSPFFFSSKDQQ